MDLRARNDRANFALTLQFDAAGVLFPRWVGFVLHISMRALWQTLQIEPKTHALRKIDNGRRSASFSLHFRKRDRDVR